MRVSASLSLATIAALALLSVGCASRPAVPAASGGDSFASDVKGSYRLESVDGKPLPVGLRIPRDSMPGVPTPAGMNVEAGVLGFPINVKGEVDLRLRVRLLACGPAASTPNTTSTVDCRPTPQEPMVGGPLPFTYKAGRITVRWSTDRRGPAEVAEGTVSGDTIALDLPFRRVYGPGRRDATWTQRFIFVKVPAADRPPVPPNDR